MEGTTAALDAATIAAVDSSSQLSDVLGMPEQLRDAAWKVESAGIAPFDAPGGLIVAGMGGSAVGALLARAALGDRASRPIGVARGYELPAWATPDTAILCSSYSGETEETLACYEAAGALGAPRIVATTGGRLADLARADGVPVIPVAGGYQPRAAVAYMTVAVLEVAALSGAAPSVRSEVDVAAAHAEALVAEWGADGSDDSLAKSLARDLAPTVPLIAGSGATAAAAYRWKTQLNENAKLHAFWHELPELDHNEIVGWAASQEAVPFAAVFLDDAYLHPRARRRIELTREFVDPAAAVTRIVQSRGETPTERVVSLVLLGDLVSIYVAVLRGVDPGPVEVIDRLKAALAESQ
ncbi:MAG: glucose/mannose-6-phosphate isomerase [Solirubrobacteraceae bacterium]|jgi:glucose/mannose-6-phosphate isomerase|nr:glucose/mannose-6-phosphate isomerase [Solirubrobacteraceae bacterium]